MSNANRDYAIVYDVKNGLIVLSRPLIFCITDKNTSNIFVKLVTRVNVGNGIDQYTDIENASNYVLTMRVIKPNNEVKSLEATQHEEESIFQFDLTEDFKDIPGKYICELTISTIVNSRQELITSDPFSYEVKRSILSNVGEIIETKDTTVEKLLNDLDATKAELSSRINNLSKLSEGSTTGDAELIDARVGANGVIHSNLGDAIRTQINMVVGNISASNTLTIGDDFTGKTLSVDISALKGQTIEVKVSCDSSILKDGYKIPVGVVRTDNVHVDKLYEITPNKLYKLKFGYNIKQINIWIGNKLANGDITATASIKNIYDYAYELDNKVSMLVDSMSVSKTLSIGDDFSGALIDADISVLKGQTIEVKISCDSSILASNYGISVGVVTTDGIQIDELYEITPNKLYKFKLDYNIKQLKVWIGNKLANGDVTLTATAKNIYDYANEINDNLLKITGDTTASNTLTIKDGFSGDIIPLGISALKGQIVEVKVSCDSSILGDKYKLPVGIVTTDGLTLNELYKITPNKLYKLKFDYNIKQINIWIGNKLANGDITATATVKNIYDSIYELDNKVSKLNHLQGLTFSVLGDSYSSYKGWIPQDNEYWYADEGNSNPENNVASVTDTWWHKLSKDTGMSLLINNSYSGSTVSTTGYNGADATKKSFVTRMVNTLGEKRVLEPKPNIIFIFGGTNDTWAGSPIGELKYSNWSNDDLKSFLPAFCYMISYIKKYNPQARIINIINTELKNEITNGMSVACQYYNIENVVLSNIGKTGGHPNKEGMEAIKNQILSIL